VTSDQYEVLAFGAKIVRRDRSSLVSKVIVTEPIEGARAEVVERAQLGGHPSPFGSAVRTRPARCCGACCLAGWAVHSLRLVALRGDGSYTSHRDTAFVEFKPARGCKHLPISFTATEHDWSPDSKVRKTGERMETRGSVWKGAIFHVSISPNAKAAFLE